MFLADNLIFTRHAAVVQIKGNTATTFLVNLHFILLLVLLLPDTSNSIIKKQWHLLKNARKLFCDIIHTLITSKFV